MRQTKLYQWLCDSYEIVCFVDLQEVNSSASKIFKLFTEHYREAYTPAERLVFYTGDCPDYSLLSHIQYAAQVCDISNNFILICCPEDITDLLKQVSREHQTDIPIKNIVAKVDAFQLEGNRFYVDRNTICPMPWRNLEIRNNGQITACNVQTTIMGDIYCDSLGEIFHSEQMVKLRNDLRHGTKATGCRHCWDIEATGQVSPRIQYVNLYSKNFYSGSIDFPEIRSLDLKTGNICNFKCRICMPEFSSLHVAEALSYTKDPVQILKYKKLLRQGQWIDDTDFVNEFVTLLPTVDNLDLFGGEPFLLKKLPFLLAKAVELKVAKNIRLHFSSNGSTFPEQYIDLFKEFREIDLALSIDNIGPRFELERGGCWQDVENNVKKFVAMNNNSFRSYVLVTVNIQNVLYLEEIIDWANSIGIEVIFYFLKNPVSFSIDCMTNAAQQLVIDRLGTSQYPILQKIAKQVQQSPGSNGEEFVNLVQLYDGLRKENFILTHKEIAMAMGCVLH